MRDPRLAKLAQLIVGYSVEIQAGDLVAITARTPALPLIEELFKAILGAGGHPYWLPRSYPPYFPDLGSSDDGFVKWAGESQLRHVDLFYQKVIEDFDALISIQSDSNLRVYANLDPAKLGEFMRSHAAVQNLYMKRLGDGSLKRVLTQYPTEATAQEADMSLTEYEEFVYGACYVDSKDPIAQWRSIHENQERLVKWLEGKSDVEIKGENVDLTMSIRGRKFLNASGKANMPDGEIFTGPVEKSVNGWVRFTYPDYGMGVEIRGIELEFVDGKVVEAAAKNHQDKLQERLNTDDGARYVGELGIGTNPQIQLFTKNILLDEKLGGTIHLALGRGYPETGSRNESGIHWDLLADMKEGTILVDGELIYENGQFKL